MGRQLHEKELQDTRQPSCKIILIGCLTHDELLDDEEYKDIREDLLDMFVQYGLVRNLHIPKPGEPDCGNVIVEYDNISQAILAKQSIVRKMFNGKTVLAKFHEEAQPEKKINI